MEKQLFKNAHYNTPGHAHELTFSVYRGKNLFQDRQACELFLAELKTAREEFAFRLWAYVIMPNHVHVLLWPMESVYKIECITKAIKGRMAKRYIGIITVNQNADFFEEYRANKKGVESFRIWQRGGGFDRNLWNPKAVHQSIAYIEANPVRKNLVVCPEEYPWSSAHARENRTGLIPDQFSMPVTMLNPQSQRIGVQ
jgi:putative transposase